MLPLYSTMTRPLSPLFIVIGILKIKHNYCWGSFVYFLEVPPTAATFGTILLYGPPIASPIYYHWDLKFEYDCLCGLFFTF